MNKKTDTLATCQNRSKRVFIIFAAAFLGLVLIFGAVMGSIALIKSSSSVVKYKGVYLSEGVTNYLGASYKYDFMAALSKGGVNCYDSVDFWSSEAENGKTYGDLLKENTQTYIREVAVGAYLFDRYTRLNKSDKKAISNAIDEVLDFRADGDVERFNEIAEPMGFDFKDFKKASQLLYKYRMAKTVIFGYEGEALKSGSFDSECETYFESEYSRVKLLIIRTDGEFVKDSVTGEMTFSEYDANTKAKVEEDIAYVRKLIENRENESSDPEGWIDEEIFDSYIKKYSTDTVNDTEGYYFSSFSSYSYEFAEEAPETVRLSLTGKVGHYYETALSYGVCFIYKTELCAGAYADTQVSHFFVDFYNNASTHMYYAMLEAYLSDVTFKDKYDIDAPITTPYNYELIVKFD